MYMTSVVVALLVVLTVGVLIGNRNDCRRELVSSIEV